MLVSREWPPHPWIWRSSPKEGTTMAETRPVRGRGSWRSTLANASMRYWWRSPTASVSAFSWPAPVRTTTASWDSCGHGPGPSGSPWNRPAISIAPWRTGSFGRGFPWCRSPRWPGRATAKRCSTPGTRTIPRTPRSSCTCLKQGIVQHYHDPLLAGEHDLQELSKTYQQITLARKRLADSLLNHYLPLYFPEMARYWESTRVAWFVAFLDAIPHARGHLCLVPGSVRARRWAAGGAEGP